MVFRKRAQVVFTRETHLAHRYPGETLTDDSIGIHGRDIGRVNEWI